MNHDKNKLNLYSDISILWHFITLPFASSELFRECGVGSIKDFILLTKEKYYEKAKRTHYVYWDKIESVQEKLQNLLGMRKNLIIDIDSILKLFKIRHSDIRDIITVYSREQLLDIFKCNDDSFYKNDKKVLVEFLNLRTEEEWIELLDNCILVKGIIESFCNENKCGRNKKFIKNYLIKLFIFYASYMKKCLLVLGKDFLMAILQYRKNFLPMLSLLLNKGVKENLHIEKFSVNVKLLTRIIFSLSNKEWENLLIDIKKTEGYIKVFFLNNKYDLDDAINIVKSIDSNNYQLRLKYLVSQDLNDYFERNHITYVFDISNIDSNILVELLNKNDEFASLLMYLSKKIGENINSYLYGYLLKKSINNNTKMCDEDIINMINWKAQGVSIKEIATRLNISNQTVLNIEKKIFRRFNNYMRKFGHNILRACAKQQNLLTDFDIYNLLGESKNIFKCLLINSGYTGFKYIEESDSFSFLT